MKKILLLLLFIPNLIFSQINEDEFYNISNFFLNILKINSGEYLFYGDKGVVMRTYDFGETYSQNYTGTVNYILSLKNHNNYVVGITNKNEFMVSQDKGNHWVLSKLKDSIVSIDANNDFVALISDFKNISITTDVGKIWKKIKLGEYQVNQIFIIENRIFLMTINGKMIYSDDIGESWTQINIPFTLEPGLYFVQKEENKISIKTPYSILELNDDLSFTQYSFETNFGTKFANTDNGYIFALGDPNNRLINVYNYDVTDNSEDTLSQFTNGYFNGNAFRLVDILTDNNIVIMTCENRGILKSTDYGKTWNVITYSPLFETNYFKFWDEKNWSIISSRIIYNSTDGGTTFKPAKDNLLESDGSQFIYSTFNSFHYFNKDSAIYFVNHNATNATKNEVYTTNDGGNTLIPFENEFRQYVEFLLDMGDYLIVSFPQIGGKRNLYKLSDGFKLDSLITLDSAMNIKLIKYNEKTYIFYDQRMSSSNKSVAKIAVSDDSLKTIRTIYSIENDSLNYLNFGYKSKNGNIYFTHSSLLVPELFTFTSFLRLDTKTDKVYDVKEPFAISSLFTEQEFIEDQKYYVTREFREEDTTYRFKYVEVKVNGTEFEYDTVGNNSRGFYPIQIMDSDFLVLFRDIQQIYKKIEPERLTSVEEITENNYLYTYPPYPLPTSNQVNVLFYWDIKLPMTVNDIEVYDMTGRRIDVRNKLRLEKKASHFGNIIWDCSEEQKGIYLININHGTESKSVKVIVE